MIHISETQKKGREFRGRCSEESRPKKQIQKGRQGKKNGEMTGKQNDRNDTGNMNEKNRKVDNQREIKLRWQWTIGWDGNDRELLW